jgi:hypothetical protein
MTSRARERAQMWSLVQLTTAQSSIFCQHPESPLWWKDKPPMGLDLALVVDGMTRITFHDCAETRIGF